MIRALRRVMATTAAVAALFAGSAMADSASAATQSSHTQRAVTAAHGSGRTALQQKVDTYLTQHPGSRQISAGRLAIPGGTVTLAAPGRSAPNGAAMPSIGQLACASSHLCIRDGNGNSYDYYYCGYYDFYGVGNGTFNNNQTSGTVARFYNYDGSLRWTNTAKYSGTASWTPVYHIRPC